MKDGVGSSRLDDSREHGDDHSDDGDRDDDYDELQMVDGRSDDDDDGHDRVLLI